jgi:hypothetical protein
VRGRSVAGVGARRARRALDGGRGRGDEATPLTRRQAHRLRGAVLFSAFPIEGAKGRQMPRTLRISGGASSALTYH